MTRVYINGNEVALKKDTTFEFVVENFLFTGSDDYSFEIEIPLKGCPINQRVFNYINIRESQVNVDTFDCVIESGQIRKHGRCCLVGIDDVSAKIQYLGDIASSNFTGGFDDIYINEQVIFESSIQPDSAGMQYGDPDYRQWWKLPWYDKTNDVVHSDVNITGPVLSSWENMACPFLLYLTKRLLDIIDYSYDFTAWESSEKSHLLCCNVLPADYGITNYCRALPHWSYKEFFDQLGYLLKGYFSIDVVSHKVTFKPGVTIQSGGEVRIDKVLDAFTADVGDISNCKYIKTSKLRYSDVNMDEALYYQCSNEMIEQLKHDFTLVPSSVGQVASIVASENGYIEDDRWETFKASHLNKLYYDSVADVYLLIVESSTIPDGTGDIRHYIAAVKLNEFGPLVPYTDAPEVELKIQPAFMRDCIKAWNVDYDRKQFIYLAPEGKNEFEPAETIMEQLEQGERGELTEYYKSIFVVFLDDTHDIYDDRLQYIHTENTCFIFDGQPINSRIDIVGAGRYGALYTKMFKSDYDLRLNSDVTSLAYFNINPKIKYHISFLSETIPSVENVFVINNKRYLCEKLTCRFDCEGMSQLIEGEFFPIID